MNIYIKYLCCIPFILGLLPLKAQAQFIGKNSAPTNATADDIVYVGNVGIFKGQVDVRQGTTRILADEMRIHTDPAGDIDKIEAMGNFYYLTPEQEVRGQNGLYTKADNKFTVTGDVILLQGDNVVTGDRLIYNPDTEEARIVGSCKGRKCGTQGRVNVLIKSAPDATASQ